MDRMRACGACDRGPIPRGGTKTERSDFSKTFEFYSRVSIVPNSHLFWQKSDLITPSRTPSLARSWLEGVSFAISRLNTRLFSLTPRKIKVRLHSALPPFHASTVFHKVLLRRTGSPPCWSARCTPPH